MPSLLSTLLPPCCPVCGEPGAAPCHACWARLEPAPPLAPPAGVDRCRSLLLYAGAGRELVARLKYRNARGALPWLAAGMAALVAPSLSDQDVVTWVPTTRERRAARGFDQAELLANEVARCLGLPSRRLLGRTGGGPQTGRDRIGRAAGPTFEVASRDAPERVLIVDDVLTTGATISAAAGALRSRGSRVLAAVTAARTPLKFPPAGVDA